MVIRANINKIFPQTDIIYYSIVEKIYTVDFKIFKIISRLVVIPNRKSSNRYYDIFYPI